MLKRFRSHSFSVPGSYKGEEKANEDTLRFDDSKGIFIIADGIGGRSHGKYASDLASYCVYKELENIVTDKSFLDEEDIAFKMENVLPFVNTNIMHPLSASSKAFNGFGTTLTAGLFAKGNCYIIHTGDSRCYSFSKGILEQITEDQAKENKLHEFLGKPKAEFMNYVMPVSKGDAFIFATDGFYERISDTEIYDILKGFRNRKRCTQISHSISRNKSLEYYDDASLIIVDVLKEEKNE